MRRNLFNEEMLSAGTGALKKIPRSQSVSVLEGLKPKRSQSNEGTRGERDHRDCKENLIALIERSDQYLFSLFCNLHFWCVFFPLSYQLC